jgi:hypothetical protein
MAGAPPHWKSVTCGLRSESTERICGFPLYVLERTGEGKEPWRVTARAHGRHAELSFTNPGDAKAWAREDYAKGPDHG